MVLAMNRLVFLPTLVSTLAVVTACSAAERPVAEHEMVVPLGELSGLAVRTVGELSELLTIGDEAREIVAIPIASGLPSTAGARRIPLPLPPQAGGSELEGVAVAADGTVWVVVERGEVFAYSLDGVAARELWRKPIVFPPGHPLEAAWQADANRRAEGLALVGERVFIVKQSDPVALVELLPERDRLLAAAAWTLTDLDDASDVVPGASGLYVLGARSEKICRLAVPTEAAAALLPCTKTWALPTSLGTGKTRWEGLAFLPDGRPVVAVDRKPIDRPNVAVLPLLPP